MKINKDASFHANPFRKTPHMIAAWLVWILLTTSCKKDEIPDPPDPPDPVALGYAKTWLTTGDKINLLKPGSDLPIKEAVTAQFPLVTVDTAVTFQVMDGFGAALTGSAAYLLDEKLNEATRFELLAKLFSKTSGIGISYVRLTMGASDFSLSDFTYNDQPAGETDFMLEEFSLAQDEQDVIPVLTSILGIAPDVKLMGSPWSPPAWMKTNGHLRGGKLKPECYEVYSQYFVKYIQAMEAEGIPITSVTPQNEPLHFTASYPCMEMQPQEQLVFVRDHLGPAFAAAGLNTQIIIYDHNWDEPQYPITLLNDPVAKSYIAGSAFHAYAGDVTAMSTVYNAHPDRGLYFTEVSGGRWATDFGDNLMWNMRNIFIGTAQNWSKCALLWNLALDQNDGPQNNGCSNCRGVVTINTTNGAITYNEEYYAIGHMSKFIRPGAVRISSIVPNDLTDMGIVAFQNTDGSKALVAANYSNTFKTFTIKQGKGYFSYSVPGEGVVTIVW